MKLIIIPLCILFIPAIVLGETLLTYGEVTTIVWKYAEASVECSEYINRGGRYEDKACQSNIVALVPNGSRVSILSKTKPSHQHYQWMTLAKIKVLDNYSKGIIGYVDMMNILKQ